jgi:hypothetical protein
MHTLPVKRAARIAAIALFVLLVAGCGGGGDTSAPPPPPAGNVGPAGATITSPDNNASLDVPPGALSATINVTLTPATDGFQSDPQIVPGTVYKLDAPDTALTTPATLSLLVPDSVASGVAGSASRVGVLSARARPLAVLDGNGLISCTPFVAAGQEVPPGTVCLYDHLPCPASNPNLIGSKILGWPPYYNNPVYECQAPNQPKVRAVRLSPNGPPAQLETDLKPGPKNFAQTKLNALNPQFVGLLFDTTPPRVQLTSTVVQLGNNQGRLMLTANVTDNVGATYVVFEKCPADGEPDCSGLANFASPPFVWTSPVMSLDDIYETELAASCSLNPNSPCAFHIYQAWAYDAAQNVGVDFSVVDAGGFFPPFIKNFFATPFALPAGGGDVVLSWAVNDTQTLSIDNGVGDVTGLASKTVHVTAPTTFTLTATNPVGSVTAQTPVSVAGQPAPTITFFTATPATLPSGGGAVTLAWATTDASTLSIDHGVGTVTGSSTSVNVTANTTFTLTATNASGTAAKQAAVAVAANNDHFVDVTNGSDANPCSQAAPCQRIVKAMNLAPSGSNVYLADGIYGSATQGTAVTVPDGVTLRATHPGAATLANVALTAAGSAAFDDIVLDAEGSACASINAGSTAGTPTLSVTGVLIKCLGALNVHGNVKATMSPGALAGGVYTAALPGSFGTIFSVSDNAELLIQGGILDGNNAGAPAFGGGFLSAINASKLTLDGVTLRNRTGVGITNRNSGAIVLKNGSLIDNVGVAGNCASAAVIVMNDTGSLTMDQSQISNSPGVGVCVRSGASLSTITLTQSTITRTAAAIASETGGSPAAATIIADGVSLTNNGFGIIWTGAPGSSIDMKNSIVTGNGTGIQVNGSSGSLKLRGSNVSNNTDSGVAVFASVATDLGTQADPGGNTFTGNVTQGIKVNLSDGQTAQAVGNTWNANQQGADGSGHYSIAPSWIPVPRTGSAGGKNYEISGVATVNL